MKNGYYLYLTSILCKQLERGEGVAYTPERLEQITKKAFTNARSSKKVSAEVAPNLPLILSPQAEDDFADILQYTLKTLGEKQVFVYRAASQPPPRSDQ